MSHVLPARLDCIVAEPGLGTAPSTSDSAAAAINANPLSDLIAPLVKGAGAILADPGIAFRTRSPKGEARSPQHHYRCMSFEELVALPVRSVAADDCFLFLWVPLRSVFLVRPLMESWGFDFSGSAFAWAKLDKKSPTWAAATAHARTSRSAGSAAAGILSACQRGCES
jgi:hypothetical protein